MNIRKNPIVCIKENKNKRNKKTIRAKLYIYMSKQCTIDKQSIHDALCVGA